MFHSSFVMSALLLRLLRVLRPPCHLYLVVNSSELLVVNSSESLVVNSSESLNLLKLDINHIDVGDAHEVRDGVLGRLSSSCPLKCFFKSDDRVHEEHRRTASPLSPGFSWRHRNLSKGIFRLGSGGGSCSGGGRGDSHALGRGRPWQSSIG